MMLQKKLKDKGYASCTILLYGTERLFPGCIDACTVLYNKKSNVVKVLSINTESIVLKKKEKARSL
ncbi:MAG: hypothetical protein LBS81_00205 [Endomicrobium sp.]|nr:hypothetical protein [Endomicrobium sp.]